MPRDNSNQRELLDILRMLCAKVSTRLKQKRLLGSKIGITIRYHNRKTITRGHTVLNPFDDDKSMFEMVKPLFQKNWNGNAVRLLGVTAHDVVEKEEATKQLDIFSFEQDAKQEPLLKTVEQLQEKFGKDIIQHASATVKQNRNNDISKTSFSKDFLDDHFQK